MAVSKLTSRGQTTIPKPIREELDLRPGDRLEFTVEGDRVIVRRASMDISELYGFLDCSERAPVSVEEMNEAIKEAVSESVERSRRTRSD